MNNTTGKSSNDPRLKTHLLAAALALALASVCSARPVAYWPYEKLAKEADLIVIATPTQTKDSGEKVNLPGIARDNKPVPGLGVNTTFEVLAVLKGGQDLKSFVLFHLREVEPNPTSATATRMPLVVWDGGCREAPPYPDSTDKLNEPFCVFPRP